MPPPDGYHALLEVLKIGGPLVPSAIFLFLWLSERKERIDHMNARIEDGRRVAAALHEAADAQKEHTEALRDLTGRRR